VSDDAQIAEGKAAWARIRERSKSTFSDWIEIGRMLIIGRSLCMKQANCNKPYGPSYQRFMRLWLEENDLQEIDSHERRGSIVCVENLVEIEAWRSTLSDVEIRRCNHPNSVLAHWRRNTRPVRSGPKTRPDRPPNPGPHVGQHGRPIFWPQDSLRRAHQAMLDCRSNDLLKLARVALEAAVRSEADLFALLDAHPRMVHQIRKPKAAITAPAALELSA
jgi:hypothetical protein